MDRSSRRGSGSDSVEIERLAPEIALLVPSGELDGGQLQRALSRSIEELVAEGVTGLIVDMRSFSMLDSSGLGALVACHGSVRGSDGVRMVLTGVGPPLHRTLSRSMLLQVLPVYESVGRALAALRT